MAEAKAGNKLYRVDDQGKYGHANPAMNDSVHAAVADGVGTLLANTPTMLFSEVVGPAKAVGWLAKAGKIAIQSAPMATQFAVIAWAQAQDEALKGGADQEKAEEAGRNGALHSLEALPVYMASGAIAGKAEKAILGEVANPLLKAATRWLMQGGGNMAGSAAVQAMDGQPLLPTRDEMIQDLVMAAPGGLHAWDEARIAVAKKMVAGTHPDVQAYDAIAGSSDPKITDTQRAYAADQAEEMRGRAAGLLKAAGIEPRLVAAFGESFPTDKYGMPIPPTVLPDDSPLLQHTRTADGKLKQTAEIPEDHPLVLKELVKSGTAKRQDLHNAIIQHFINEAKVLSPGQKPVAYLTGGGGGAGKSTFWGKAKELLGIDPSRVVNINADDIKLFLPEFESIRQKGDYRAAEVVHNESNFIANKLLEKVTNSSEKGTKYDIMLDRTLANQEPSQKLIKNLKQKGYGTHLIGLTIDPFEGMIRAFVRAKRMGDGCQVQSW